MSNQENLNPLFQKIKSQYEYLINEEPTPDDEIESREDFIKLFKKIQNQGTYREFGDLLNDILETLEGWDALDLWFDETSLPKKIGDFIELIEEEKLEEEKEKVSDDSETAKMNRVNSGSEDLTQDKDRIEAKEEEKEPIIPQIDVSQIVMQVSEKFKGEIKQLQEKINSLEKQLDQKEVEINSLKDTEDHKIEKIVPKTEAKLTPPKIKIPSIKVPKKAPTIKYEEASELTPDKDASLKLKKKEKQVSEGELSSEIESEKLTSSAKILDKLRAEIEGDFSSKQKATSKESEDKEVEESEIELNEKKEKEIEVLETNTEEVKTEGFKSNQDEISNIKSQKVEETQEDKQEMIQTEPKKSKLKPMVSEVAESVDRGRIPFEPNKSNEKTEEITKPFSDLSPIPTEEPIKVQRIENENNLTPVPKKEQEQPKTSVETSKEGERIRLTPVVDERPKITPINVEEIDTSSIESSGTNLFNVFSSMGDSQNKKKQAPPKKVKEEKQIPKHGTISQDQTIKNPPASKVSIPKSKEITEDTLPQDKDSLYQELIALEGRRYSIEKTYKELSKNYEKGAIDEYEFTEQSQALKERLDEIGNRITKIRRALSSL
ncbi:MAG: hypothetical protein GF383_01245 [Candidatus Lokiarchaeota archaeon]|nr:hypothetical protein [Candidatus Lokiarchaeota archaeon]MBD3337876.1 hypothetical protein [Candidatus Lokiarchaeota archaeon]